MTRTDDRARVLADTDITDVVGDYVALKPKGREHIGLCPFHDDRSPSMYVVPNKQIFHCFSCGAGGNVIDFVMRYHGMGFREALELLAHRAGLELTPWKRSSDRSSTSAEATTRDTASLAEAAAFANAYFRSIFTHAEHGHAARAMAERRGIDAELLERFGIGAAADRWDGLVQTVRSKKLDLGPFVDAGLVKVRDSGGHYDAFRNRLIFPIADLGGRIVGFGGRRLDDEDEPKYLNSPESELYHKGALLYGHRQAQRPIARDGLALLVEGYTDVIACHKAGFDMAVATLGTALTPRHAAVLRRTASRVVLLFDGDEAGVRAAERAVEVFFAEPVELGVLTLPGGQDPDDFLRAPDGPGRFRELIDTAEDALAFLVRRRTAAASTDTARAEAARELLARFVHLGLDALPPVRRTMLLRRLGAASGLHEAGVKAMYDELRTARTTRQRPHTPAGAEPPTDTIPTEPRTPREHALACVLADPSLIDDWTAAPAATLAPHHFDDPAIAEVARVAHALGEAGELSGASLIATIESPAVRSTASAFSIWADRHLGTRLGDHYRECIARLGAQSAHGDGTISASIETKSSPSTSADRLEELRSARKSLAGLSTPTLPRPLT
ncbi:MAG: DNA primase [Planctomycetota bacterium]